MEEEKRGQYWFPVNLDKKEFIHPHKLGTGLRLWEQLADHPGTGAGLIILTSAMPEQRDSGDFDLEENQCFIPDTEKYFEIAKRTIGRWAGDRIAIVGNYAKKSDLPHEFNADKIFDECSKGIYKDISDDVCKVIEHELHGKFIGEGLREFKKLYP